MNIAYENGKTATGKRTITAFYKDDEGTIELARAVQHGFEMWCIEISVTGQRRWATTITDTKRIIRESV